jgi:general secretion pathway protein C
LDFHFKKMPAISIERSNPVQAAVVALATFAALALLGLVLAYWTWAWFAPRPEPRVPAAQIGDGALGPTRDTYVLFGGARRDGTGTAPAAGAIMLLGIVAASGNRPGYAVLRIDGKQTVAVTQGADVEPGMRLAEIHVDHVVLERSGARESLAWPQKAGK